MLADALTRLYASSRRTQKLYAGLVLVFIVLALTTVACLAWSMVSESYSLLQNRRAYLGSLLTMADAAKGLDSPTIQQRTETQKIFLEGKNRDVIGAELQNWINTTTQTAGAELQSIENIAGDDDKNQSYIGLSANIFGAWKPIQNVIFLIETAQPVLFVRDLEIHAGSYGQDNVEPQVTMRISFRGATRLSPVGRE